MAVIGLSVFSIAIAIFSAFHSAPIPHLHQDVDYPVRLLGSFGFGCVFSTLEKMAEKAFATEYNESYLHPLGLPESLTPQLDALTMSLSEFPHSTSGLDDGFDTEEASQTPTTTDSPSVLAPITFVVSESPVTKIIQAPPAYDGPVSLTDFNKPKRATPPKAEYFESINLDVNFIALTTYIGTFLLFIAYLFFLKVVARAAHRSSRAEVDRAAASAKEEIDSIISETQSHRARLGRAIGEADNLVEQTLSEIPNHKDRLLAKVDEVEKEADKAIGKESITWARILGSEKEIKKACDGIVIQSGHLQGRVEQMSLEHLHMPNFAALLGEKMKPFEKLLAEAKDDIAEGSSEVEALVTKAQERAATEIKDVQSKALRGLPAKFMKEKTRLEDELRQMEDIKASYPEVALLRAQVAMLEESMATSALQVRNLEERVKASVSGLPDLTNKSNRIDGEIQVLGQHLLDLSLALNQLRKDRLEAQETLARIEEDGGEEEEPAAASDSPAASLPDLPADLEADLLGDSSGSEAEEETGEEGEKEGAEGPEELVGGSEGNSGPESPVRRRRSRPNQKERARIRARAQAAPPSSDAGGGNEAGEAGSGGK